MRSRLLNVRAIQQLYVLISRLRDLTRFSETHPFTSLYMYRSMHSTVVLSYHWHIGLQHRIVDTLWTGTSSRIPLQPAITRGPIDIPLKWPIISNIWLLQPDTDKQYPHPTYIWLSAYCISNALACYNTINMIIYNNFDNGPGAFH